MEGRFAELLVRTCVIPVHSWMKSADLEVQCKGPILCPREFGPRHIVSPPRIPHVKPEEMGIH